MTISRLGRAALAIAVALSPAALAACSRQNPKGEVTVLALWTGSEKAAFTEVLKEFERQTGIVPDYQDTRALPQVLQAEVKTGNQPDVAIMASVGEFAEYARGGNLVKLDGLIGEHRRDFKEHWLLPMGEGRDRHIYAVPYKVSFKSAIWYRPGRTPDPLRENWERLVSYTTSQAEAGATPWCMGMGDAPSSGGTGTDAIEDILLHRSPEVYAKWATGRQSWSSPEVRDAWETWHEVFVEHAYGGSRAALSTDFQDGGRPMFADPPGCLLEHQGSFIVDFYEQYQGLPNGAPRAGADFDFFPFPPFDPSGDTAGQPWLGAIDLAVMFNDTREARELIRFLATPKAQRIWPSDPDRGGGAIMANEAVDAAAYRDPISRKIAGIVHSDRPMCFDASDAMPPAMRNAFSRAVLEYLNDPGRLTGLLDKLDAIHAGIPQTAWLDLPCGDKETQE
ncbi:ABC transporter substrate-binding protein [Nonomuraea rubra]|uniref:ABC transporter substrate-binding protein n=1 Tax=Nonomuraea rubra TaxID=46180 RepID=UPI0033DBC243